MFPSLIMSINYVYNGLCQITKAFCFIVWLNHLRTTLQIKEIRHKNLLHAESPCKVIVK